jgi:hypothetical protein
MRRRQFLASVGGAILAPSLVPSAKAAGSSDFHWCHPTRPFQNMDMCDATIDLDRAPVDIHTGMTGVPRFKPPGSKNKQKRRTWSELRNDKGYQKRLRQGYDTLLRSSSKTSLLFQTSLHSFYCADDSTNVHTNWYFLPWHRAFLYFHECALRAILGDDFRLPAWDWEKDPSIPKFYAELGLPSFLTKTCGRAEVNGKPFTDPCVLQAWLFSNRFEDFCGGPPPVSLVHADSSGRAVSGPHSSIHLQVVSGAMRDFALSAADPVFYSHHANIDRFWRYWMSQQPDQKYPSQDADQWRQAPMYLYNEADQLVDVRPCDLIDEEELGYFYDQPALDFHLSDIKPSSTTDLTDARAIAVALLEAFRASYPALSSLIDQIAGALNNSSKLVDLITSVLAGGVGPLMQKLSDFSTQHAKEQVCVPAQLQLNISAMPAPGYYLLVLSSGNQSANVGGFGVFSHAHQARPQIPVAAALPVKILNLILNAVGGGGPLKLEYGELGGSNGDFQSFTTRGSKVEINPSDLSLTVLRS